MGAPAHALPNGEMQKVHLGFQGLRCRVDGCTRPRGIELAAPSPARYSNIEYADYLESVNDNDTHTLCFMRTTFAGCSPVTVMFTKFAQASNAARFSSAKLWRWYTPTIPRKLPDL